MKTITLNGFVHCKPPAAYDKENIFDGLQYSFWEWDEVTGYALVKPATITIEIDDDFNPNGQFIDALEAKKKALMAEFQARVTEIDRQISQFTAITMEAA